jgi:hypothetical protein
MSNETSIEVEGIRFRAIMPDCEITTPHKQQIQRLSFGVEITNTTQSAQKFLLFYFRPEFRDANQEQVQWIGPNTDSYYLPEWHNFSLLEVGESIAFTRQGQLYWHQDSLRLAFREKNGSVWTFIELKPGEYSLQMRYRNPHSVWNQKTLVEVNLQKFGMFGLEKS